ncbi:MAG: PQQ-binding-like beta-propeller repeat protein, partial [Planctomycetaceae bacterium]|nr:PQQ-binding-like beta-propeller repeat protein [Planctomycetaceae bacterium]
MAEERTADASRWLDPLRTQVLIPTSEGAISGRLAADLLKRRLPRDLADRIGSGREAAAEAAWKKWQASPSIEGLQDFCGQFGDTEFGLQGWLKLATRHHDDRRWTFAATAWEAAAAHPRATPAMRNRILRALQELSRSLITPEVADTIDSIRLRLFPSTLVPRPAEAVVKTRPAPMSRWSAAAPISEPVRDVWPNWLREMRSHGVRAWPSSHPLVVGDLVWLRTAAGLTAWHLETGAERSQISLPEGPVFLESVGRRLAADSLFGRLSSDGRRIFLVHGPSGNQSHPFGFGAVSAANEAAKEPHNFLAAYDSVTQEFLWRVGGAAAGPTYALADEFFCGPPLVVDDVLFVIGQQHSELQLLAIRADQGELLWKLALGDVPRALAVDPARQRIACTPILVRGQLLCPTGAGAVLAVNPLTRSITWVQRHGAALRELAARPRSENTTYLPDLWWEGWREAQILGTGSSVIVASPESEMLYAADVDSGRRLWSAPRDKGLCLLGTSPGGAVVVEPFAVRMHDLRNGAVLWRSEIGDVVGRGVLTDTHAVVPTAAGGVVRVALSDGAIVPDDSGAILWGNLWSVRDGWLSTGFGEITAWQDMTRERLPAGPVAPDAPLGPQQARDLARLDLAAGEPAAARQRLAGSADAEAEVLRHRAWLADLRQTPQHWRQFQDSMLTPATQGVDRVAAVLALGRAATADGDPVAAARLYLSALSELPGEGSIEFANPRRLVRPDLALVSALGELLADTSPGQQEVAEEFRVAWRLAASAGDPFEIRKLSDLCSPLPIVNELLPAAGRGPFLGQSLLGVELRLLKGHAAPLRRATLPLRRR